MTSKTFSNCGTESHSKSNEGQTIGQGAIRRHSEHPSILKPFTGCSINSTPLAIAALRMASHPQEVTWCPPCQSKAPCTSSSLQKKKTMGFGPSNTEISTVPMIIPFIFRRMPPAAAPRDQSIPHYSHQRTPGPRHRCRARGTSSGFKLSHLGITDPY